MHFALIAPIALSLLLVGGCGTSDYGRLTSKIATYEGQAAVTQAELATTKDPAQKIRAHNALISLSRKELELARRINPETNPNCRNGTITLQQSRDEKAAMIAKLEQQLARQTKDRDEAVASLAASATPSK